MRTPGVSTHATAWFPGLLYGCSHLLIGARSRQQECCGFLLPPIWTRSKCPLTSCPCLVACRAVFFLRGMTSQTARTMCVNRKALPQAVFITVRMDMPSPPVISLSYLHTSYCTHRDTHRHSHIDTHRYTHTDILTHRHTCIHT